MRRIVLVLVFLLSSSLIQAQFIKEKSINAQIGLGATVPYESATQIGSNGLFLQGELVLKTSSWFELRPYAGFITTDGDGTDIDGNPTYELVEITALLLEGKARVRASIP